MARYTQTLTALLSHAAVSDASISVGSALNVAGSLSGTVYFSHAWIGTASITRGADYYLQASPEASDNKAWSTLAKFTTGTTAADTEAFTGTRAAGLAVIPVASTTGFQTRGDLIYIKDGATLTDSEWHQIKTYDEDVSVTLFDGLTETPAASSAFYSRAERFVMQVVLSGVSRVRAIAHNSAGGNATHSKCSILTSTDLE